MKKAVIAMVPTRLDAENIVSELRSEGFGTNDISVLFPDQRGAGGLIGGTLGLLAGIGPLAVPGLGAFIAAGPLMAAMSGAAAGGMVGALAGMGIPEYEARIYEGKVRSGSILVSVHTDDAEERALALSIFERAGVEDATTRIESNLPDEDDDRPTNPVFR